MTQRFRFLAFVFCLIAASAYAVDDSPLFKAVEKGDKAEVEVLLSKGAGVNTRNKDGDTPLLVAASYFVPAIQNHTDVAELLIARGADVNVKDKNDNTPLQFAAGGGHKHIVELLIANGANVNVRDNKLGDTPLHSAAVFGHKDVAELLIAKGADVNAKNKDGRTPLFIAISKKHDAMAAMLRQHGGK